jgi:hypothetical protein
MNADHKTDVLAELAREPIASADHIGVTAKDGAEAKEIEIRRPLHAKLTQRAKTA